MICIVAFLQSDVFSPRLGRARRARRRQCEAKIGGCFSASPEIGGKVLVGSQKKDTK